MAEKILFPIRIDMKAVMADIRNMTFLTGEAREDEGKVTFEAAQDMKASDDEDINLQLRGSVRNAIDTVRLVIGEYLVLEDTMEDFDGAILEEREIGLMLVIPSNFNRAAGASLPGLVHDYIVKTAVGEWFGVTNKADAAEYLEDARRCLTGIRTAIYERVRPKRLTPLTFCVV